MACALLISAGVQAQKDVTSQYIKNATLSNGTAEWTVSNFNAPQSGNFNSNGRTSYNTQGYASEAYSGWNSFDSNTTPYYLKQTITLPAGHYTLVNYSFYREGESYNTDVNTSRAKLFAGSNEVYIQKLGGITAKSYANTQAEGAIVFDSKMYRNAVDFTIDADNTEIEIGLTGTFEIMRSWCIAGKFELINNDIPATMDAPFDVTGYITNPGFEYRDMTGWEQTPSDFFGTQNNNQSFKTGEYFAEKWQPSNNGALGEGSFSQTLDNLPAGFYKLTVNLGGNGTYVSLNGKTANWEADKDYTVGYVLSENENLTITAGKTAEGTANWIHFDNFRLQFCGDVAAALTTLCAEVTNYESKLSASDYATLQNAVNGYNKNYSDVDELLAAIDAVQALYDAADLYVEFATALDAAQAIDQIAPMNADVLSALQTALATQVTMQSTAAEVVAATNALQTATANATTSIANYSEAKTLLNAANSYDATGQASYAADETIHAIQTAYDDRSLTAVTAEQKTAAQEALSAACKAQAQPADNSDMSACIQNWDFLNCENNNYPGWTISKTAGYANKYGTTAVEYWNGSAANGGFDYYQTITDLPTGVYTIQGNMWNSTDNESGAAGVSGECGVYGKSASAEVFGGVTADTRDGGKDTYTTDEIMVVDGTLRLGVKNNATMGGRWFGVDWIKLTYVRQLKAEEEEVIEKANAEAAYNEALAATQAITEGTIPAAAYTSLQTVITNNTLTDGTSSEYNNAATAINNAATAAGALVAPYAAWKEMKAYADALVVVANDNTSANKSLDTDISNQNAAAEAATTTAAIEEATSTLKTAMETYAGTANPVGDGAQFNLTFMLTNPDLTKFWDETWWIQPEGWYKDQTDGNFQVMNNGSVNAEDGVHTVFMEYYYLSNNKTYDNGKFNIYTKATLPAGTYTMNCYAFAKEQNYSSGAPNAQVYFYANDTQGSLVNADKLTEQSISFVNKSEQEVKIGLKPLEGNTYNWMGIGYVKLYKVPAQSYTVDETIAWDNTVSGAGTVTLNRTIKAGYNTLVLPFSMTQAEVEEEFGEGSIVYVASSYDVDKDNISFTTHDGISANMPCLLDATKAGTSYTLENRTIVAGEPVAEGKNVTMMGTYEEIFVPKDNGNYIISGGKIYEVDGQSQVKLKGTRAYINIKSGSEARTLTMSFDDTATGIATVKDGKLEFETGDIYDLSGRKVKNPTKGIYLMNGKKVIK